MFILGHMPLAGCRLGILALKDGHPDFKLTIDKRFLVGLFLSFSLFHEEKQL